MKKIINWLEKENVEFEYEGDLILINYDEIVVAIYIDEDMVRFEDVARIPSHINEKLLTKSLQHLAYDLGVCFRWDGSSMGYELFKIGVCVPYNMLTKKFTIDAILRVVDAIDSIIELIEDYGNHKDCSVLDLSMFMDGDQIDNMNFDMLLHLRDTRFGGSWGAFREAVKKSGANDAVTVVSHIDKCIKFEEVNNRKLSDVHQEVRDELITLFEELDEDIIYS